MPPRQRKDASAKTAAADKDQNVTQDEKVTKVDGEPEALAPNEDPTVDSNYTAELAEQRIADGKDSPQGINHDEKNSKATEVGAPKNQLDADGVVAEEDQRKGTGEPNGDEDALESDEIDSAGEQKNSGQVDPKVVDTTVVGSGVLDQKSVGALARAEAPKGQNLTAIAESPVEVPNGERVVTFATPPRVAVVEPQQDENGDVPRGSAGQRRGLTTNGVTAGPETLDSGIIPDPSVAETDGTFMPSGAPNETYSGEVAPDGLYTGAELNTAPLAAPEGRPYAGPGPIDRPKVADAGVALTAAAAGDVVDEATGETPDLDSLFVPVYEHGTVMRCTKRLIEKTSGSSGVLLLPIGAQVSTVQAEQMKARIRAGA